MDMTAEENKLPLVMSLTKGRKRRETLEKKGCLNEKPRQRQRNCDETFYEFLFSHLVLNNIILPGQICSQGLF